jgi:CheY-like chemotaxis protein
MQGGSVAAHSAGHGQGSEFIVRLPARRSGGGQRAAAPAARRSTAWRAAAKTRARVDDNPDVAESTAILLRVAGYDVQVALDGKAALAAVDKLTPHAVLLDIGLPGMDGYQVAARMRERPALARTLIVACPATGRTSTRRARRWPALDHHLVKPIDLDAVVSLLADRAAWRRERRARAPAPRCASPRPRAASRARSSRRPRAHEVERAAVQPRDALDDREPESRPAAPSVARAARRSPRVNGRLSRSTSRRRMPGPRSRTSIVATSRPVDSSRPRPAARRSERVVDEVAAQPRDRGRLERQTLPTPPGTNRRRGPAARSVDARAHDRVELERAQSGRSSAREKSRNWPTMRSISSMSATMPASRGASARASRRRAAGGRAACAGRARRRRAAARGRARSATGSRASR